MQVDEFEFYQLLQKTIVDKKDKLNSGNLVEFFEPNQFFELALSLSYMILTKDMIKAKEEQSNVDFKNLDYLFTEDFCQTPPKIYEAYDNSPRWIIGSIRDSLLHNAYSINLEEQQININNPIPDGNLYCDIPFEWFNNYAQYHILDNKLSKEVNVRGIFLTSDTLLMQDYFHNEDDIKRFLDNIITYDIKVKSPEPLDENLVKRYIENFMYVNTSNLISQNNLEYLSYNAKWNFIKQKLITELKKEFPKVEVSVEKIKDPNALDDINKLYNTEEIFEKKEYKNQYAFLVNKLIKNYKMSKTSVIDSLESLISTMKIYNQELKNHPDYTEYKEIIDYILNLNNDGGKTIDFIHQYRKSKGLPNTYDSIIIGDSHTVEFEPEDRNNLKYYLTGQYGFEPESIQLSLGTIKCFNEQLYSKYSKKYSEKDLISNEDLTLYNENIIKMALLLRQKTAEVHEFLELGLVTALGITTYAMNKEAIFDREGYEEIDDLQDIPSYSSGAYKSYSIGRTELENKIKNLENKLEKLKNNPDFKSSKKKEKLIQKLSKQLTDSRERLKNSEAGEEEIITYNNRKYKLTTNNDTARIIRNCLSHLDRIKYTSYDEGMLLLEDERGIIKCNIEDLYNFILNDTFMQRVRQHYSQNNNGPKL